MLDRLRREKPLVHHITNYVTANDCANMVLAAGASPVMADDPEECAEMTAAASALVLNLGTLDARKIDSMRRSGRMARDRCIPVVLDPVGCGATILRTETARMLLQEVRPSVVRGNISEIQALYDGSSQARGVDADQNDWRHPPAVLAAAAARAWGCIAAVTGPEDIVSDGQRTLEIDNGCAEMARITGTGCMCTSLIAAFCGASPNRLLDGTAAALIFMGLCGEHAKKIAMGPGTFHAALFDQAAAMTGQMLEEEGRWHEI